MSFLATAIQPPANDDDDNLKFGQGASSRQRDDDSVQCPPLLRCYVLLSSDCVTRLYKSIWVRFESLICSS